METFFLYDKDEDMMLSKAEFREMYMSVAENDDDLDRTMMMVDCDRNGMFSMGEIWRVIHG